MRQIDGAGLLMIIRRISFFEQPEISLCEIPLRSYLEGSIRPIRERSKRDQRTTRIGQDGMIIRSKNPRETSLKKNRLSYYFLSYGCPEPFCHIVFRYAFAGWNSFRTKADDRIHQGGFYALVADG